MRFLYYSLFRTQLQSLRPFFATVSANRSLSLSSF